MRGFGLAQCQSVSISVYLVSSVAPCLFRLFLFSQKSWRLGVRIFMSENKPKIFWTNRKSLSNIHRNVKCSSRNFIFLVERLLAASKFTIMSCSVLLGWTSTDSRSFGSASRKWGFEPERSKLKVCWVGWKNSNRKQANQCRASSRLFL